MKKHIQRYAGVLLASAVMIGGIASAANVDPIPTISNTFAISGQVIKSADINKLAEGLNILDARTNNFKNNITVNDDGKIILGKQSNHNSADIEIKNSNAGMLTLSGRPDWTSGSGQYAIGYIQGKNLGSNFVGTQIKLDADDKTGLISFKTANNGVLSEQMRINPNGNVGIGTTTPAYKLDVNNSFRVSENGGKGLEVEYLSAIDGTRLLAYDRSNSAYENLYIQQGSSNTWFDKNGNVGIGTVTPTEKLDVVGKIKSASTASTDAGTTVVTKDYLSNLPNPVSAQDAATKSYVDSAVAAAGSGGLSSGSTVSLGGSIINNYLDFSLRTAADCDSATEAFVEVKAGSGNGYCIEKAERTGGHWEDAASTCINAGKRLPEPFEWKFACQNATALGLSNMTNNWEWASNFPLPMHNDTYDGVGAAVFGNGGCHFASWNWLGYGTGGENAHSFRCVR